MVIYCAQSTLKYLKTCYYNSFIFKNIYNTTKEDIFNKLFHFAKRIIYCKFYKMLQAGEQCTMQLM